MIVKEFVPLLIEEMSIGLLISKTEKCMVVLE